MSVSARIAGKWYAARSLAQFLRYLRIWPEIFDAYRTCRTISLLARSRGIALDHESQDDPIFLFRELFEDKARFAGP